MPDWRQPPYSAICRLLGPTSAGTGWFAAPRVVATAAHVLASLQESPFVIVTAFGSVSPGGLHFTAYQLQGSGPGDSDDWGFVEIPAGLPLGCSVLKMCVPDTNYRGLCRVPAFDIAAPSAPLVEAFGQVSLVSAVRFLHTADTRPAYSGAPVVIAAAPVGFAAIGVHTDSNRSRTALDGDPGGGTAASARVYAIATSLTSSIQEQLGGAIR